MRFYLGTHKPPHLARTAVPLFLSRRQLAGRTTYPRAAGAWRLDSGGYTELILAGQWELTAPAYAAEVRRYATEIGGLELVACRDWLTVPDALRATGRTVPAHQAATIDNYLADREELGDLVRPVLQGWTAADYLRHVDAYTAAGVDLATGVTFLGSVASRDAAPGVEYLIRRLACQGLSLHILGGKDGLARYADVVEGADSLAWSREARRRPPMAGHSHAAGCQNCLPYALEWRRKLLDRVTQATTQPALSF